VASLSCSCSSIADCQFSGSVANEPAEESPARVNPSPSILSSTNLSTSPRLQPSPQKSLVSYEHFRSSSTRSATPNLPPPHPPQSILPTSNFILASRQVDLLVPRPLHSLSTSHASSPASVMKSEPFTFSTNSSLALGSKNVNR
jgi:hypothetical protein